MNRLLTIYFILQIIYTGQVLGQDKSWPVGISQSQINQILHLHPLKADTLATAAYRWKNKPVLKSRLLDNMESLVTWRLQQLVDSSAKVAHLLLSTDKVFEGKYAIKVTSATKGTKPGGQEGRPWEWIMLKRDCKLENWEDFNRLSVQIYPEFAGFQKICMGLVFYNEGDSTKADIREAYHYIMLEPGKWNQLLFEIPHLNRNKVNSVAIMYRLQGNQPEAADTICFYADKLELQQVKADKFEGWDTEPETIVFSHAGYASTSSKTAFTSDLSVQSFSLINAATGETVLSRLAVRQSNNLGTFGVFDFSSVKKTGIYKIVSGKTETKPFPIGMDTWKSSVWKTINFFYTERCGFEVPGVHGIDHADWQTETYKGQKINLSGGWHDAGDVSQSLQNTADGVKAFFKLAKKYDASDPVLARRLHDEGKWGLQWILKNRFPDGARSGWTTIDFWTDGIIGTVDDVVSKASINPANSLRAAIAEAAGAQALRKEDPQLAAYARKIAIADWELAIKNSPVYNLEYACSGVQASVGLYQLTHHEKYARKAVEFANYIISCQQQTIQHWSILLSGFFYRNSAKDNIWNDSHLARTDPAGALVEICSALPAYPQAKLWLNALMLYAAYCKKTAAITSPYYFMPSSVYHLKPTDKPEYTTQVLQGLKLDSAYYLRMFPVWFSLRGNNGVQLSKTAGLAAVARLLKDEFLMDICRQQLYWVMGRNPFNQSLMYGEGYDYAPQYSALSGDIVGSLPVGIETKSHYDVPYWPVANCYNYKEVWVMPSVYWLQIVSEMP